MAAPAHPPSSSEHLSDLLMPLRTLLLLFLSALYNFLSVIPNTWPLTSIGGRLS
ncbi:conserved hypothetical protein [Nitrospira sp. ND1]|nr:conserved hypothetical protein [Nitrospira sp. ND1]